MKSFIMMDKDNTSRLLETTSKFYKSDWEVGTSILMNALILMNVVEFDANPHSCHTVCAETFRNELLVIKHHVSSNQCFTYLKGLFDTASVSLDYMIPSQQDSN